MFMRHRAITKGFGPNALVVTVEQAFQRTGVRTVAGEDGWRLGDSGAALVLCQVMGINDRESHLITVAASEDQQAVGICDQVSDFIESTVHFDE